MTGECRCSNWRWVRLEGTDAAARTAVVAHASLPRPEIAMPISELWWPMAHASLLPTCCPAVGWRKRASRSKAATQS